MIFQALIINFFNGANPISPVQAVRTFTTNDFSIYDEDLQFNISVVVTNAAGCSDTDSVLIDLNYVTANPVENKWRKRCWY